ncbi:MAG: Xaa-Pro peptidase family protein [Caldilineaceae bacterium]
MHPSIQIPPAEFAERVQKLVAELQQAHLAGAVLFDNYYILYYTGFAFIPTERPVAFAVNAKGEQALFVPRLELEHAQAKTNVTLVDAYLEYPDIPHPMQKLKTLLTAMGIVGNIGVDTDGYPWIFGYQGPAVSELTGAKVTRLGKLIEAQMAIKSQNELALIRESCKWGNLAHRLLQKYTKVGATETAVSMRASQEATQALLDTLGPLYRGLSMFSEGASAGYRGQIGRNAAIPHALAMNATFMAGDVLVTGAGCPLWGYNSELERTMIIGAPTAEQRKFCGYAKEAQEIAFRQMRAGVKCSEVDKAVRTWFQKHDLQPYWKHHSGHAIGLRYHEGPFLDVGDDTVLQPGMVFTVEPGLYNRELGGFRHSDTVVVTADGVEFLTYYPRDLESLTIGT